MNNTLQDKNLSALYQSLESINERSEKTFDRSSILSHASTLIDLEDEEGLREGLRELCKSDLFFLSKHILGYKDLTERTHGGMCATLQRSDRKRKLLCCPRGSFKSSLGVVSFAIFRALQKPNIRVLLDSELFTNSANFIREIRGHLESQPLTSLFGEFKTKGDWTSSTLTIAQRWKNLKEPTFTASGIGSEKTGQHYDLIIIDDINGPQNSQTEEGRLKVIQHYRYMNAILEPNGELILIGTRYAANDCYGFVIENELDEEQRKMLPISLWGKRLI